MWNRTFGYDEALSVISTEDGGFVLAGGTKSFSVGSMDAWLIKTDANGNEIWKHTFGTPGFDKATSVAPAADGGFVVAGFTDSFDGLDSDGWLFKTDSNGNEVWSRTFGRTDEEELFFSVKLTADGGYILAGETYPVSGDVAPSDVWLIKTDGNGNKVWDRTFGGPESEAANSVAPTADGGYILAGVTTSFGAGGPDVWRGKWGRGQFSGANG